MQSYTTINDHHIGLSHIQSGLQCEDHSDKYIDDKMTIAVVSDGHGDRNCFRSKRGAEIACEVSIDLCRQFLSYTEKIQFYIQVEELLKQLEYEIVTVWKKRVLEDAKMNPFQDNEMEKASEQARSSYDGGGKIEKAYGCTLVLAMITESFWFGLQIGDGKCVSVYSDGIFVEPVPTDEENCLGNRSTSLCNSNAPDLFRHYYSTILPSAVYVVSDGVEESFDQMGLYNFFYSVAYWLTNDGEVTAKSKLKDLLPQISEGGSGDDVSLSAIIQIDGSYVKPKQTLGQVYERVNACKDVVMRCDSMLEKTIEEKESCDKTTKDQEAEISKLEEELIRVRANVEVSKRNGVQKQNEIYELTQKKEKAAEQLDKVIKYKESAEIFWREKYKTLSLPFVFEEDSNPESNDNRVEVGDESAKTDLNKGEQIIKKHYTTDSFSLVGEKITSDSIESHTDSIFENESNEADNKGLSFDELISVYKTPLSSDDDANQNSTSVVDVKKGWSLFRRDDKM